MGSAGTSDPELGLAGPESDGLRSHPSAGSRDVPREAASFLPPVGRSRLPHGPWSPQVRADGAQPQQAGSCQWQ